MLLPRKLPGLIYVAIGIFVAASKDYFENLETAPSNRLLLGVRYNPPPWPATRFVSR